MTVAGLGLDSVNVGLDTVVYRPPSDPDWIAAWSITDALLLEIAREVQQRGAKFLVAAIGNPEQVNPDELPRQMLEKSFRVPDLSIPTGMSKRSANVAHSRSSTWVSHSRPTP